MRHKRRSGFKNVREHDLKAAISALKTARHLSKIALLGVTRVYLGIRRADKNTQACG